MGVGGHGVGETTGTQTLLCLLEFLKMSVIILAGKVGQKEQNS